MLPRARAHHASHAVRLVPSHRLLTPRPNPVRQFLAEERRDPLVQVILHLPGVELSSLRARSFGSRAQAQRVPREPVQRRHQHAETHLAVVHLVLHPVPAAVGVYDGVVQVEERNRARRIIPLPLGLVHVHGWGGVEDRLLLWGRGRGRSRSVRRVVPHRAVRHFRDGRLAERGLRTRIHRGRGRLDRRLRLRHFLSFHAPPPGGIVSGRAIVDGDPKQTPPVDPSDRTAIARASRTSRAREVPTAVREVGARSCRVA
mmetsp:Transcript_6416/g.26635  ORF Transcript_6416/g.26635 Transcript_6416/m.26635 type:complete len:258 (-) Transcript_6416:14-787(-)